MVSSARPRAHSPSIELFEELVGMGFMVGPGDIGENVVTARVDLLSLPVGTRLRLGATAVVVLSGLRNPCAQLDDLQRGLMAAVLDRAADGARAREVAKTVLGPAGRDVDGGTAYHVSLILGSVALVVISYNEFLFEFVRAGHDAPTLTVGNGSGFTTWNANVRGRRTGGGPDIPNAESAFVWRFSGLRWRPRTCPHATLAANVMTL